MEKEKPKSSMTVQEMASLGGKTRAEQLTKKRRKEIAKAAAAARWKDKPAKKAGGKSAAKGE